MLGFLSFLAFICFIAFIVSIFMLIVCFIKKQKKKPLVILSAVSVIALLGLSVPISDLYEPSESSSKVTGKSIYAEIEQTESPEPIASQTPEISSTDEPSASANTPSSEPTMPEQTVAPETTEKPSNAPPTKEPTASPKSYNNTVAWAKYLKLGISESDMVDIYHTYEKTWKAARIAKKYNITKKQVSSIYSFMLTNYGDVAAASVGRSLPSKYSLEYGKLEEVNSIGSIIVIKAKIESNLTNKLTIEQNYYDVCGLIQDQGLDVYDEVQYWAIADMTNGEEAKVISFDVPKQTINGIVSETVLPNQLEDYLNNLWIHPSLR